MAQCIDSANKVVFFFFECVNAKIVLWHRSIYVHMFQNIKKYREARAPTLYSLPGGPVATGARYGRVIKGDRN